METVNMIYEPHLLIKVTYSLKHGDISDVFKSDISTIVLISKRPHLLPELKPKSTINGFFFSIFLRTIHVKENKHIVRFL